MRNLNLTRLGYSSFFLVLFAHLACSPVQFFGEKSKKKGSSKKEEVTQTPANPQNTANTPSNNPNTTSNTPSQVVPPPASEIPNSAVPIPATAPEVAGFIGAPIIGIINMDSKYQITNEGYRISVEQNSEVLASGPMNLKSIMDGEKVDMQGSAYGQAFLTKSTYAFVSSKVTGGTLQGKQKAKVSICMPEDLNSAWDKPIKCKNLNQFVGHSNGSNTFIGVNSDIEVKGSNVVVTAMHNTQSHGNCGTSTVPCASVMHPIFGFASKSSDFRNDNASPLVLDLNKNQKIDLISAWNKSTFVFFPVGAKANEKIRTGWVAKEDGLLALDLNGDRKITDSTELFGEFSNKLNFENGYLALAAYDENKDNIIDSKDKNIFNKLLVWQDLNSDGKSSKRELASLTAKGIKSIDLRYTYANPDMTPTIVNGNEVRLVGNYTATDGKAYPTADVWFELRLGRKIADILDFKSNRK